MKEIYIWTDAKTVKMLADNGLYPIDHSHILFDKSNKSYSTYLVAKYNEIALNDIPEEKYNKEWWREVSRSNTCASCIEFNSKPYRPRFMRKVGLLEYLCDYCGVSTERNVSAVIGELAYEEGKTPIEFFNSISHLGYDK